MIRLYDKTSDKNSPMICTAPRQVDKQKNEIELPLDLVIWRHFYAAEYNECFSMGVKTPRLRCNLRLL